jgi:chemotaxis protein histidine kinase CheA
MVGALGVTASQLEQALSQNSSAVREAAARGTRAAERAEAALGCLCSVRLDAVLDDLPRIARRLAKKAGRGVELVLQPTNLEVHAARAEKVNALVKTCLRALIGLPSPRGRSARGKAAAHLSLDARSEGENLYLRFVVDGFAFNKEQLKAALETARKRLHPGDGALETEGRKGEGDAILLMVRQAAAAVTRSQEFILARAGEAWYAIPASSVAECIEASMSTPDYVQDEVRLPTMRMNDTRNPRVGVVVKTPRGSAVLLFDVIGGREMAVMNTGGDAEPIAGISGSVRRPDGSRALLVDLGVLLPAP